MTAIAWCGIDCARCGTYLATQGGDGAELERLAGKRRERYGDATILAEVMACDGCRACGRLSWTCGVCPIRTCAADQGVTTCAECQNYDGRAKLKRVHTFLPEAKATLDALRP